MDLCLQPHPLPRLLDGQGHCHYCRPSFRFWGQWQALQYAHAANFADTVEGNPQRCEPHEMHIVAASYGLDKVAYHLLWCTFDKWIIVYSFPYKCMEILTFAVMIKSLNRMCPDFSRKKQPPKWETGDGGVSPYLQHFLYHFIGKFDNRCMQSEWEFYL